MVTARNVSVLVRQDGCKLRTGQAFHRGRGHHYRVWPTHHAVRGGPVSRNHYDVRSITSGHADKPGRMGVLKAARA